MAAKKKVGGAWELLPLAPNHVEVLQSRGITPAVAAERGYKTIAVKARLTELGFGQNQCSVPALLTPLRNAHGEVVDYQSRSDTPRARDGKAIKYELPGRSKPVLDVPPGAASAALDASVPLLIAESPIKADAAVSICLCAVAILGVSNWRRLAGWADFVLKGRTIFLAPDSDMLSNAAVWREIRAFREWLEDRGATVKIIILPAGEHGEKTGLDDFIAAQRVKRANAETIRRRVLALATDELPEPPQEKRSESERPEIRIAFQRIRQLSAASLAIIQRANDPNPEIFQQAGAMVRFRRDMVPPEIEALRVDALRGVLDRVADWNDINTNGDSYPVMPPLPVVKDMLALPGWDLPRLDAIAFAPFFDAAGNLIASPGYHPEAATILCLDPGLRLPPIPLQPTAADVCRAKNLLLDELLVDFPFDGEPSRAHALATVLYMFARQMIDRPAPLIVLDAPQPGSGKGLLCSTLMMVALGHPAEVLSDTADQEELRKRITSLLMSGTPGALIDNTKRKISASTLAALLTADVWKDRILGGNRMGAWPNRTVWCVTGNNIRMSGEMFRRAIASRVDAQVEHPENRTEFKHADILTWAHEQRGELVWAVLVLIQNWIACDRPEFTKRTLGSFEKFSRVIGGILETAEIVGFLEDREKTRQTSDDENAPWRAFVAEWAKTYESRSVMVPDLLGIAKLHLTLHGDDDHARSVSLGRALSGKRDAVISGWRITVTTAQDAEGRPRTGWRLQEPRPSSPVSPETGAETGEEKPAETQDKSPVPQAPQFPQSGSPSAVAAEHTQIIWFPGLEAALAEIDKEIDWFFGTNYREYDPDYAPAAIPADHIVLRAFDEPPVIEEDDTCHQAFCPLHDDDRRRTLRLAEYRGRVSLRCIGSRCAPSKIIRALRLRPDDLIIDATVAGDWAAPLREPQPPWHPDFFDRYENQAAPIPDEVLARFRNVRATETEIGRMYFITCPMCGGAGALREHHGGVAFDCENSCSHDEIAVKVGFTVTIRDKKGFASTTKHYVIPNKYWIKTIGGLNGCDPTGWRQVEQMGPRRPEGEKY